MVKIKAAQFGPKVQAYIGRRIVLAVRVEYDNLKVALNCICHTMVTGG